MKTHAIAIYGTTKYKKKVKVTYKQRYWKIRKDKIKQRYTKKVIATKIKLVKGGQRITIYGTPKQIKQAKTKIQKQQLIPKKKYVDKVHAQVFLKHPEKYTRKGRWVRFAEEET